MTADIMKSCALCPRKCGADRTKSVGFCGESDKVRIARADLHMWEEPCLSIKGGSGTVFFTGCSLRCCFCQNYEISALGKGFELTVGELADTFLMLQSKGAENIDLVSPTHFVPQICEALDLLGDRLTLPVIYNCGGYELPETLQMLGKRVSIFLPDLKYYDSGLSKEYSAAPDYFPTAMRAIKEMVAIAGKPKFDKNGKLISGVIVRHLVLPNHRHDSIRLMQELGREFNKGDLLVSIMSQFTPVYKAAEHKALSRRTSTFEYQSVVNEVIRQGFDGYFQQRASASEEFIPEFFDSKYY